MSVPVSDLDLCTVADVQSFLQTNAPVTADPIQVLITRLSRWAMTYCSRDFRLKTYNETRNGRGNNYIMTAQRPLVSVASVTVDGQALSPASGPPYYAGYSFDSDGIYVYCPFVFTRNKQNVSFSYTAGWITPGMDPTGATVTLPGDIMQAVVEVVAERFKRRDTIGVTAKTIAGEMVQYSKDDLPKTAAPVFDAYRNLVQVL